MEGSGDGVYPFVAAMVLRLLTHPGGCTRACTDEVGGCVGYRRIHFVRVGSVIKGGEVKGRFTIGVHPFQLWTIGTVKQMMVPKYKPLYGGNTNRTVTLQGRTMCCIGNFSLVRFVRVSKDTLRSSLMEC